MSRIHDRFERNDLSRALDSIIGLDIYGNEYSGQTTPVIPDESRPLISNERRESKNRIFLLIFSF